LTEIDPEKDSVVLTPGVVGATGTVPGLSQPTVARAEKMAAKMSMNVRGFECMIDTLSNRHTEQHPSDAGLPSTV
jgi:hypothetical protein